MNRVGKGQLALQLVPFTADRMRHEACELEDKDCVLQCNSVCLALCASQKAVMVMWKCLP